MPTKPSPAFDLRLFGRADLVGPPNTEARVILGRPKLLALLSYLAAATPQGFHRRDTLVALLWGELDQEHARGALRQSLYHLRNFLADDVLTTRGDEEIALAADRLGSDVATFESHLAHGKVEDALDLYTGDLLEGFHLSGAVPFERWLDGRRDELRRRAYTTAWALALDAHAAGRVAAAGTFARRALRLAPLDEAVLRQVIGLLDQLGDRVGAFHEYEVFAKRLREELDLAPAPETRALVDDIRSRDEVVATPSARRAVEDRARRIPWRSVDTRESGSGYDAGSRRQASIAVLPFLNMGPDPDDEYLSDGFAEEITNALTRVRGLKVASRTSAFAFRDRDADARRIGRELGVMTVLEGSLRRAGDRLRITAQLVEAEDGYHLWSDSFDREATDIFAIQDDIARNIARVLRILLTDEEDRAIVNAPTTRLDAYEHYLRGRFYLHRFQKHSVRHAREMFERAISVDPEYALAYAGQADCSSFLYMYFDGSEEHLVKAEEASRRALALAPNLAEAHAAHGLALSLACRYEEADTEFRQAIERDPSGFEPHYFYGRACFHQGRLERAVALFEKACKIREDHQARALVALALQGLGRTVEAKAAYDKALQSIGAHLAVDPGDARALTLGAGCLARLDRPSEALDWCRRGLDIDPEDPVVLYSVACVDAVLGRRLEALAGLERAIAGGLGDKTWIRNDPDFASLRDDPAFRALVGSAS